MSLARRRKQRVVEAGAEEASVKNEPSAADHEVVKELGAVDPCAWEEPSAKELNSEEPVTTELDAKEPDVLELNAEELGIAGPCEEEARAEEEPRIEEQGAESGATTRVEPTGGMKKTGTRQTNKGGVKKKMMVYTRQLGLLDTKCSM